jgi:hypothetical protein
MLAAWEASEIEQQMRSLKGIFAISRSPSDEKVRDLDFVRMVPAGDAC